MEEENKATKKVRKRISVKKNSSKKDWHEKEKKDRKGSRPDRKQKLEKRKTHTERVVKSCLLRYLHGDLERRKKIQSVIQDRVETYSKRINWASIVLLGYLRKQFEGRQDFQNIDISHVFDQTFIRQIICGHESHKDVDTFLTTNPFLIRNDFKRQYRDRNIYSSGATSYITNLKVSLKETFTKRLSKFLKTFQEINNINDNDRIYMYYVCQGWKPLISTVETFEMNKTIHEIREILNNSEINKPWFKSNSNLERIIKLNTYINRYYEYHNLPTFNLVPISKVKTHFITIDKSVLYGIFVDAELTTENEKTFNINIQKHWDEFLNIKKLNKKYANGVNKEFTGTVQTDGIVLCMHFQRPTNIQDNYGEVVDANKEDCRTSLEYKDVVGAIDPGRVIIYNVVVKDQKNNTIKEYKLKREQYYNDAGIYAARKKSAKWNNDIQIPLKNMSKVSSKGVSFERYLAYVGVYLQEYDNIWNEYLKPKWSRQRFRLYSGKKRVFAKFFNAIQNDYPKRRILMAYGSAKFAPGSKNEVSVPTTSAFKECVYRFPTLIVDEFRTSKIHHENDSILQLVKVKGQSKPLTWFALVFFIKKVCRKRFQRSYEYSSLRS